MATVVPKKSRDAGDSSTAKAIQWQKGLKPSNDWDKDELMDVIYWYRQIFGLALGIAWGLIPMSVFVGNVSFVALNALLFFLYYSKYLGVDVEQFGSWDLFSEGFMSSYGTFLVLWICIFSLLHAK